jgi:O-acetyl-ADP-ribose deacetylase (regulator of RNase III)
MSVHYISGDATNPIGHGNKIIPHVCNDLGKWGKGFVLAVSNRWPRAREFYYHLASRHSLTLGTVQLVRVERSIWVANMIAQHGIYAKDGVPPIRYEALIKCLKEIGFLAHQLQASIHMPRIGCGLAGGKWEMIEPMILDWIPGTEVLVYGSAASSQAAQSSDLKFYLPKRPPASPLKKENNQMPMTLV